MIIIRGKHQPVEMLIKRFKRAVEYDGLLDELKERQFYKKPATLRKEAARRLRNKLKKVLADKG